MSSGVGFLFSLLVLLVGAGAFGATRFLLPFIIRKSHQWGILDLPSGRKAHCSPTPRLGGLSIAPGLWIGCACAMLFGPRFLDAQLANTYSHAVIGLLLGCSGMFLLGFFDDVKQLNAQQKLIVQTLIALVAFPFLPSPESVFGVSASLDVMSILLVTWLVIIPNSVNLLDGVDGLTATLVILFLGVVSFIACWSGQYTWLLITVPSSAAVLSFLRFNWSPAKVFLGDSGSLTLGFMVAYLSLYFSFTGSRSPSEGLSWNPVIGILLTLPWIADTVFAITRRYIRNTPSLQVFIRRSKAQYFAFHGLALTKIWCPDRGHIHHQLQRLGFKSPQVVGLLGLVSFVSMGTSAILVLLEDDQLSTPQVYLSVIAIIFTCLGALFFMNCVRAIFASPPPLVKKAGSDREIAA